MDKLHIISYLRSLLRNYKVQIPIAICMLTVVIYIRKRPRDRLSVLLGSAGRCVCNWFGWHHDHLQKLQEYTQLLLDKDSEIKELKQNQGQLLGQLNDYTQRLSAEMGKKISANESAVENVGVKNRPMNIADEFSLLCNNEWHEAKEACDDNCGDMEEADKLTLLYCIMMLAEDEINIQVDFCNNKIVQMLSTPFEDLSTSTEGAQSDNTKKTTVILPLEITNTIGDYMRNSADSVNIEPLEKIFRSKLDENNDIPVNVWQVMRDNPLMQAYISMVMRLVWKMALQRPKMTFESCSEWKGEEYQDLFWASSDPTGKDISRFSITPVYPMLYHSKQLMNKGKVLLQEKEIGDVEKSA